MPVPRIHSDSRFNLHFITPTVLDWIDIFTSDAYFTILAKSLQYCVEKKGLELFEYVFMTNHIHFIAQAKEDSDGLDAILRDFKRFTNDEVKFQLRKDNRHYIHEAIQASRHKKLKNDFQLWQETNYPEIITTENFLNTKIQYIWYNPVKKGYVLNPENWRWSSAGQKLLNLEANHPDVALTCLHWNEEKGSGYSSNPLKP